MEALELEDRIMLAFRLDVGTLRHTKMGADWEL